MTPCANRSVSGCCRRSESASAASSSGLMLRGIARNAQAHGTNAIGADAGIVSGKGVREPVVARAVVASNSLGGVRQHVRRSGP